MRAAPVAPPRAPRRRVDGVLLLDKPVGLTSNAALQRAKRLYAAEKAGHTGTLDPLASGLLPICFGEATKFAQALLDARKEYVATVRFGVATSTGDAEGEPVAEGPVAFSRADLEAALPGFVGEILQVPPRHAALKREGRAYYDYARAGIEIPRVARGVHVGRLELVDFASPVAVLRIECGKGTYVRALAEDLAAALGTCAHLAGLRRTACAGFALAGAITLEALEALAPDARDGRLLPVDAALGGLPALELDAAAAAALVQGRTIGDPGRASGRYRCYTGTRFLGTVEVTDGVISARRLIRAG